MFTLATLLLNKQKDTEISEVQASIVDWMIMGFICGGMVVTRVLNGATINTLKGSVFTYTWQAIMLIWMIVTGYLAY